MITDKKPLKVRYKKFSGDSGWIPCDDVTVREGVLMIRLDDEVGMDMVPLHVVRGRIEVRAADFEEEA